VNAPGFRAVVRLGGDHLADQLDELSALVLVELADAG
jgi:hypothetical protein